MLSTTVPSATSCSTVLRSSPTSPSADCRRSRSRPSTAGASASSADLWRRHRTSLEPEVYREITSLHGIDLVAEHPSCFRSKTDDFDDLLVANIELRFRRLP
jgi:hypothetical protein